MKFGECLIAMNKARKIGLFLVLIGFFIPSILYPFTSLTVEATLTKVAFAMRGVLYDTNLGDLEVVLVKGAWKQEEGYKGHFEGRSAIPYKYTIAFGIALVFIGISLIALSRKEKIP